MNFLDLLRPSPPERTATVTLSTGASLVLDHADGRTHVSVHDHPTGAAIRMPAARPIMGLLEEEGEAREVCPAFRIRRKGAHFGVWVRGFYVGFARVEELAMALERLAGHIDGQ